MLNDEVDGDSAGEYGENDGNDQSKVMEFEMAEVGYLVDY